MTSRISGTDPGRPRASGTGWPTNGFGRPEKTPRPSWLTSEVLPCMSTGAWTIRASEGLPDALMPEAHPEDRDLARELLDHREADS